METLGKLGKTRKKPWKPLTDGHFRGSNAEQYVGRGRLFRPTHYKYLSFLSFPTVVLLLIFKTRWIVADKELGLPPVPELWRFGKRDVPEMFCGTCPMRVATEDNADAAAASGVSPSSIATVINVIMPRITNINDFSHAIGNGYT